MHRIERPRSLTELVFLALKDDIVSGELQMGDALSEARIAERLHVSRTPVREAFARLELEGLVDTEPQRGTYVFTMGTEALREICDTRVCLETAALEAAFERHRTALVEALRGITEAMTQARKTGDDRRYLQLDTAFHQTLLDHSGNRYLNDAYQTIASKMAALRNRLGAHPDQMAKSFVEHCRMVELLEAGELDRAREVLIAHIGRKEGSYWNR
ncbi:MAG: GntR family transcriptional regulator [Burkholderiales bacterium]|nr:MAG: GntR family transcriptional regulator [Burkholderiales bacterium]